MNDSIKSTTSSNILNNSNVITASANIQISNANTSNIFILSDQNGNEHFNIFTINCQSLKKDDNNNDLKLSSLSTSTSSIMPISTIPKKLTVSRFNYKCKFCAFSTKFKAHTIEHMFKNHKINLMQCPELSCGKTFKDEWKLKRHLLSNREHKPLANFKNLSDVMKQYVEVTPQKLGFPCPLCQFDDNNNLITQNQTQILANDVAGKNMDNYLFLDTYEHLKTHIIMNHSKFDLDSYFICKQCGQVFINRYKLSCHLFNVHSGKRKRRPTAASKLLAKNENGLMVSSFEVPQQFSIIINEANEFNVKETINNVASGLQNKG